MLFHNQGTQCRLFEWSSLQCFASMLQIHMYIQPHKLPIVITENCLSAAACRPMVLDDSGHVITGMLSASTTVAEEENDRYERQSAACDAHEERPVELEVAVLKLDVTFLCAVRSVDCDGCSYEDHCNKTYNND